MCAADVAVDLRYPHRGEVSGSLSRSMQVGRPTIVSATGTYLDLPEDVVVRVPAVRIGRGLFDLMDRQGPAVPRQADAEGRAMTLLALYGDRPTVGIDDR